MTEENKKILALFDFDGTITTRDTLFLFLHFYSGSFIFLLNILISLPVLILFTLKIIPNWKAKEFILKRFLKDEPVQKFERKCRLFTETVLPKVIRPLAKARIEAYQNKKAHVVVVSASAEPWVLPWCKSMGIDCIATLLEVKNNRLTGRMKGRNCHGKDKVNRIKNKLNTEEYQLIEAYGDSKGDFPMFQLAHQYYYKPFRSEKSLPDSLTIRKASSINI